MPSLRARFFHTLLRNRHLFQFRLRPETVDWSRYEAILRFRRQAEEGSRRFGRVPKGIEVVPVSVEGIPAEWIHPAGGPGAKTLLYFHGGGYVSGSCSDHRAVVAKFVRESGVRALLFEYRLAPENVFPAAVDDAVAAYRWLLEQGVARGDVVFAGESAGGGLALATLVALKDQADPLPAGAVALSPWTDLKCTGDSYGTNAKRCLSPHGTWTAFARHYAGDTDPGHPWISPLYADLEGLPPLLLYAGGDEILRDDSIRFAEKARRAGVDVTLHVGAALFHCYPVMAPLFPEATRAMEEIGWFIRTRLEVT